ncbi:MAG: amidohydrolase family protein, partial [Acidimicrobiales bacterium]|nr:amidohydrolase family protein [Acidimicrobiales bacterium]
VAHCPTSNMKLGSGIAPVRELLAAGVNVALGTDGAASNDDLDLWDEMALAPLLARVKAHDPGALTATQALLMATANGGRALGLNVGTLATGSWADIVRVDLDRPSWQPLSDPNTDIDQLVSRLVFSTKSRDVTDVWVAGERVVSDRVLTTIDLDEAMAEVQRRGRRLAGRSD